MKRNCFSNRCYFSTFSTRCGVPAQSIRTRSDSIWRILDKSPTDPTKPHHFLHVLHHPRYQNKQPLHHQDSRTDRNPLRKDYLYFAHRDRNFIRLSYANNIQGPWTVYEPRKLRAENSPAFIGHITLPKIYSDHESQEIRIYFQDSARTKTKKQPPPFPKKVWNSKHLTS